MVRLYKDSLVLSASINKTARAGDATLPVGGGGGRLGDCLIGTPARLAGQRAEPSERCELMHKVCDQTRKLEIN